MDGSGKSYANLHLHSTHSDGVYTPAQLARIAFDEGYRAIALTDHDTVTGNPEARSECEKLGMGFIFGAEFSVAKPDPYHIVGFDFDPGYPEMAEFLRQYRTIRRTRLDGSFCACYDVEILKNRLFSCDFSVITDTKISRQYTHANCAVLP